MSPIVLPMVASNERLEQIVEQFEESWQSGSRPRIENFLPDDGERSAVLVELIHVDLELRWRAGEPARAEEYIERYPELAQDESVVRELYDTERVFRQDNGRDVLSVQVLPKRFGRFDLIEELGRGSTGVVFRGIDSELDRVVAIKLPLAGSDVSQHDAGRLLREARLAARLRHPSIATVYEVGRIAGTCYLVQEFIDGTTLAERLRYGRMGLREAVGIVERVAVALQCAHDQGILHRDIKPSNILLDAAGRPYVIDFGLARRVAGDPTLTADGQLLGTPAYMSPEQARGDCRRLDSRSDVYSLGVVLYELLTGERPFRGSLRMLLNQVLDEDPRPPRRLDEKIPRDLETICLKAMAKEPASRYATAAEVAAELVRWQRGEPIRARPVRSWVRGVNWARRHPAIAGLTGLVALVAALGCSGITWQWNRARAYFSEARFEQQRARSFLERTNDALPVLVDLRRTLLTAKPRDPSDHTKQLDQLLRLANQILEELPWDESFHVKLAHLHYSAANISQDSEIRNRAIARCRMVLSQLESSRTQGRSGEFGRRVWWARISSFLGILQCDAGQLQEGILHLKGAIATWEELLRARPSNRYWRFRLATDSDKLGKLYHDRGQETEAVAYLEQAAAILREFVLVEPTEYTRQLAPTILTLGTVRSRLDQSAEAIRLFQQAAELYGQLVQEEPSSLRYRTRLAASLHCLGRDLADAGQLEPGLEALRRAREVRAALVRDYPDNAQFRSALEGTTRRLTEVIEKLNQWQKTTLISETDSAMP